MEKAVLHKGRCTDGLKGSKMAEQASLMKTAWTIQPHHKWQKMLNQLMLWFRTMHVIVTDTAKLDISCRSAYFMIHKDFR